MIVFIVFCAVHGLKDMRNQLYTSRVGGLEVLVNNGNKIEGAKLVELWQYYLEMKVDIEMHVHIAQDDKKGCCN